MGTQSPLRLGWDVLVGVVATYSAVVVPLGVLDQFLEAERWLDRLWWPVTTILIVDAVLQARRTRSVFSNWHVSTPSSTLLLLVADALAAVPIHAIPGADVWELLRLAKLFRVAQLMHDWRLRQVHHSYAYRLGFFVYWLGLAAHWIACGWVSFHRAGGPDSISYLDALYWCVTTLTTVGYGDIVPNTPVQKVYAIGVMLLGIGVYGYIIGNIATLLANRDPVKNRYLEHREKLAAFLRYRHLPDDLQRRVREYYTYLWEERLLFDEPQILEGLPPALREDISMHLRRGLLERVPLFRGADPGFVREVALHLHRVVYTPGDLIIRSGDQGNDMFFIDRGRVQILNAEHTVTDTLSDGDFFGEIALFLDRPRTADVRAVTFCDVYRLDRTMLEKVLLHHPDVAAKIEAEGRRRFGET